MKDDITARAAAGERLEADQLAEALNADILSLGMAAADVCRRQRDGAVFYRRVHVMSPVALTQSSPAPDVASEIRLSTLPETRELALEAVRLARQAAGPARAVTGFAFAELADRAAGGWGELDALFGGFAEAGLTDLVAVEADRVGDVGAALDQVRRAGLAGRRLAVRLPLGARRLEVLGAVRDAIESRGSVELFAPLPAEPATDVPTTGYEDLRLVALARLALAHLAGDRLPYVSVDWDLYGPKLAQVALTFGADHLDTVHATDDPALGRRRASAEEVERNVRAAGLTPGELDRQVRA
ncbi:MAG: hypothetical protein AB7O67_10995 [Vicinamibacterales bacterium]